MVIVFGIPLLLAFIDLFYKVFYPDRRTDRTLLTVGGLTSVLVFPLLFLALEDGGKVNDCCSETAFFSPDHRLSIYVLILLGMISFCYSVFRKTMGPPLAEVLVNCLMLIGIAVNVVVILHHRNDGPWILGNLPIILFFISALIRNHQLFIEQVSENGQHFKGVQATAWRLLNLPALKRIPLLIVMCLPILILLIAVLLLFGQKPDSLIRAFTDTYRNGLSQWDYKCKDVICSEGHYLCSVAANGHRGVVSPLRLGQRGGKTIVCNRQLLVSNAFEEWLEEKCPWLHRPLRRNYNKVGRLIHRYYGVFNRKWVSDLVYVLMKPLEWIFLFCLYLFDKKPESRIAVQYLSKADRASLKKMSVAPQRRKDTKLH